MANSTADDSLVKILSEIRNWIRAAAHTPVKELLEEALPDSKSRTAYQMFDGTASGEQIRIACKMSPNAVVALAARCTALGLMSIDADKKRTRLFDLNDFGLLPATGQPEERKKR
jgi:hypothetical protein